MMMTRKMACSFVLPRSSNNNIIINRRNLVHHNKNNPFSSPIVSFLSSWNGGWDDDDDNNDWDKSSKKITRDESGRKIRSRGRQQQQQQQRFERQRRTNYNDNDDDDDDWKKRDGSLRRRRNTSNGPSFTPKQRRQQSQQPPLKSSRDVRFDYLFKYDNDNNNNNGGGWKNSKNKNNNNSQENKIDLRAIEAAGLVHLYGLSPVLHALSANRRLLTMDDNDNNNNFQSWNVLDDDDDDNDDNNNDEDSWTRPETRLIPYLFVQDRSSSSSSSGRRSAEKAEAERQVEELARMRGVPIARVDKGILNTLCGSRPHQGFVLRCGTLSFQSMQRIPHPSSDPQCPRLWLILDEVIDPQNLGALLRSAYFLGKHQHNNNDWTPQTIGVLVCTKNSAPPSSIVSAASAGALELYVHVYSTSNLPKTLYMAKEDGWMNIIGASSSSSSSSKKGFMDDEVSYMDLSSLENDNDDTSSSTPTLLVLGSEGHGLRTLVARACTGFIRIPSGNDDNDDDEENSSGAGGGVVGVDSLNVSVTGGILLWHFAKSIIPR